MVSLNACPLPTKMEIPITKIPRHNLCCKSLKASFLNSHHIQNPLTFPIKFLSNSSYSNLLRHRHCSHSASLTPMPTISKVSHNLPPCKNLSRILVEKIVGFVIGSVFVVGCFNIRAAAALPAQTRSSSANLEETRETQKANSEDEEMYEKILEEDPRNVGALKVVLYGKMRRGSTKEAVKYVERLIDVEPDEVEWRLLLALCYEILGQLTTAKRLFQEILEEKPLLLRALHGIALVMHKNHEGPAVFVMLNKALAIAQREKRVIEERNIRILIAQMHVVKGELEEGLNKFQDLVNADPRDFRPYLCQGIIYSLLDQKKEASEQFETYRALAPEEFPQRAFLDDVVLAAKAKPGVQFQKEFDAEFSNRK